MIFYQYCNTEQAFREIIKSSLGSTDFDLTCIPMLHNKFTSCGSYFYYNYIYLLFKYSFIFFSSAYSGCGEAGWLDAWQEHSSQGGSHIKIIHFWLLNICQWHTIAVGVSSFHNKLFSFDFSIRPLRSRWDFVAFVCVSLCRLTSEHMNWDKWTPQVGDVGWFLFCFWLLTRTSWQPWIRPGTLSTSSVHTVEACLETRVSWSSHLLWCKSFIVYYYMSALMECIFNLH